jgi:hypothetical protein
VPLAQPKGPEGPGLSQGAIAERPWSARRRNDHRQTVSGSPRIVLTGYDAAAGDTDTVTPVNKNAERARAFLLLGLSAGTGGTSIGYLDMPWKNLERVEARKCVSTRFDAYVSTLMGQFVTSPEELLRRAEAKLHAPLERPDRPRDRSAE